MSARLQEVQEGEMARNKHPEETVNLILDVSMRLFLEKGYEHTSIQDIINHLGGLSKGAIYHHFKSKEDILVAVTDKMTEESNRMLAQVRDRTDLNGKDKLKEIFRASLLRPVQDDIFTVAPDLGNNPRLMFSIIRETMDLTVPDYILPIIRQGIQDGSIRTEYPQQLAGMIMFNANIWMNPMLFDDTPQETLAKFMLLGQMMKGFGLDIVDGEMLERMQQLAGIYQKNKSKK